VTCWAGRNRSGLVTAIALHKLTGFSGVQCVRIIRKARPLALTNLQFRAAIKALPALPRKIPRFNVAI
jgi:protein-tyrosine phosphatase